MSFFHKIILFSSNALFKSKNIIKYVGVSRYLSQCNKPPKGGSGLFSKKYLVYTNIATTGLLLGLGDTIQQEIEYRNHTLKERYDFARIGRMFTVGLCALGPLAHNYYSWLARTYPQRTGRMIAWKLFLDETLMAPMFITTFFVGVSILEFKTASEIFAEYKQKFLSMYLADLIVWPPGQFINFYIVPVRFQVLYINMLTLIYSVILSYLKHKH